MSFTSIQKVMGTPGGYSRLCVFYGCMSRESPLFHSARANDSSFSEKSS